MRRWIFTIASAVSLILCLIFLFNWFRSWLPRNWEIESSDGRLVLIFWDGGIDEKSYHHPSAPEFVGADQLWQDLYHTSDAKFLRFQVTSGLLGGSISFKIITIPFWFLVPLTAVLPIVWFRTRRRHRLRHKLGHCLQCGYDLRHSKDKCPECGSLIPAPSTNLAQ
jgi:hypothetical protein